MKKKLFLLLFVLLMLSGCVKSTTTMKIGKTKSINFETNFLVSTDLDSGNVLDKINQKDLISKGYNISTIKDEGYSGVKISKRFLNIDRVSKEKADKVVLSDLLKGTMDDSVLFKVEKSFFKNTYYGSFDYRTRSEIHNNGGDEVDMTSDKMISLDGEMFFKFILEVPYGTVKNNANEVSDDGKTLTWVLNRSQDTNINFVFTLYNLTNVYIVAGISLFGLIVLGIIVAKIIKTVKENNKNSGPIHVDYDPSIEDKLSAFEIEEDLPPEVATESENNKIDSFEFKLEEEEKAKIAIVEAAKVSKEIKQQPKFMIDEPEVEDINKNNSVK